MARKLYNLARMTTATTGTATMTLGVAVSSYLTFALAGVANAEVVTYSIKDGGNSELGRGTYTSSGTTLSRDTVLRSTNSDAKISLSGSAEVSIQASAEDFGQFYADNGTVSLPPYAFSGDPDTGQYWIGANNLGFACAGAKVLDVSATGLGVVGAVTASGAAGGVAVLSRSGTSRTYTFYDPDGNGLQLDATGASGTALTIGQAGGLLMAGATGGLKGNGTINAGAVYDDNVLLTDIAAEFFSTGKVDTDKWDAMVPDLVLVPARVAVERTEERPMMEPTGEYETKLIRQKDGTYLAQKTDTPVMRSVMQWVPVYDADGNGVGAVHEAVLENVVIPAVNEPAQTRKRRHEVAHLFKAMVDEGFDPRDPVQYFKRMRDDKTMPGLPTAAEWEHGKFSTGEMITRQRFASELALHVIGAMYDEMRG